MFVLTKFLAGIEIFRKAFFCENSPPTTSVLACLDCLIYFMDSSLVRRSICFVGPHLLFLKRCVFLQSTPLLNGQPSPVLLPCCCSEKLLFSSDVCKRWAFLPSRWRGSLGAHVGLSCIALSVTECVLNDSCLREITLLVLSEPGVLGVNAQKPWNSRSGEVNNCTDLNCFEKEDEQRKSENNQEYLFAC